LTFALLYDNGSGVLLARRFFLAHAQTLAGLPAARIMIELRNKHTLTGKHAAFRSYVARSSAAISLAKA
jgi:hypothetical protein